MCTLIDRLKNAFQWMDNETQGVVIVALALYGKCTELQCVVAANLATAYKAAGKQDKSLKWSSIFFTNLKEHAALLRKQNRNSMGG